jgi:nucleotide-binding universal stress UspA family protein
MPSQLIIGYDGSEMGDDALALGAALADRLAAGPVVATVIPDPYRDRLEEGENLEAAWKETSGRILDAARTRLAGVDVETTAVDDDSPSHGLRELAESVDSIMIVLGSAHRGRLGRLLVGSVGAALLAQAPCPIAVAPRGYAHGDKRLSRVGVAVSGSAESWPALEAAADLASRLQGSLTVLGVAGAARSKPEIERVLDRAIDRLPSGLPAERNLMAGDPAAAIGEAGAELDLLVVGSRGQGPIRRALHGSVSTKLIEEASCPILVVPRGSRDARSNGDPCSGPPRADYPARE